MKTLEQQIADKHDEIAICRMEIDILNLEVACKAISDEIKHKRRELALFKCSRLLEENESANAALAFEIYGQLTGASYDETVMAINALIKNEDVKFYLSKHHMNQSIENQNV